MYAIAEEPTTPDDYYSPRRVEMLLRQIPYYYDMRDEPLPDGSCATLVEQFTHGPHPVVAIRRDDERGMPPKRRPERNAIERQMGIYSDVLSALERCGYFTQLVIWYCVIGNTTYRDFASWNGVSIGHLSDTKKRGLEDMAYRLGWREQDDGQA